MRQTVYRHQPSKANSLLDASEQDSDILLQ